MSLRSLLNGTSFTLSSLSLFIENSGILVNEVYLFKKLGACLLLFSVA
jgi:hypothetical protein